MEGGALQRGTGLGCFWVRHFAWLSDTYGRSIVMSSDIMLIVSTPASPEGRFRPPASDGLTRQSESAAHSSLHISSGRSSIHMRDSASSDSIIIATSAWGFFEYGLHAQHS